MFVIFVLLTSTLTAHPYLTYNIVMVQGKLVFVDAAVCTVATGDNL